MSVYVRYKLEIRFNQIDIEWCKVSVAKYVNFYSEVTPNYANKLMIGGDACISVYLWIHGTNPRKIELL